MPMATTYDAYSIVDSDGEQFALVWWNGTKLCSLSDGFLKRLKRQVVDGHDYTDGEEFFKKIPNIYKSGYSSTRKAKVDAEGNIIK